MEKSKRFAAPEAAIRRRMAVDLPAPARPNSSRSILLPLSFSLLTLTIIMRVGQSRKSHSVRSRPIKRTPAA